MQAALVIFLLSHTFKAICMLRGWPMFIEHLGLKIHSYTYFQQANVFLF